MGGVVSEQFDQADRADRILSEGGIGMGEVARRLGKGKGGRPTHPSTPARWATGGVVLPGGQRLYLESVSLPGGRLVTSWPAVLRFIRVQQSPPKNADAAAAWLRRAMLDGMAPLIDPVPVEVAVLISQTWGG